MKILIDGYNLLHASGIFGGVRGAGGFEASRRALLDEIARLLGPAAGGVTVIFDAGPRLLFWVSLNGQRVQYSGTDAPSSFVQ